MSIFFLIQPKLLQKFDSGSTPVENKTPPTNLIMIDKVDGLLWDGVAPAVVAEDMVGNGDRAPALQVDNLLAPASWSLAIRHNRGVTTWAANVATWGIILQFIPESGLRA